MEEGIAGKHCALGDLTNKYGKRGVPLVPGKFVIGNGIGRVGDSSENADSRKRICRGPESLFKAVGGVGGSGRAFGDQGNSKSSSFFENLGNGSNKVISPRDLSPLRSCGFSGNGGSQVPKKGKELSGSLNPGVHFIRGNVALRKAGGALGVRNSWVPEETLTGRWERGESKTAVDGGCVAVRAIGSAGFMKNAHQADAPNRNGTGKEVEELSTSDASGLEFMEQVKEKTTTNRDGNLTRNLLKSPGIDGSSQLSGLSGPEPSKPVRVANLPKFGSGHLSFNEEPGPGSSKDCSCSFCLKAAFIWTGLLYQDAKDRLVELKSSRREARILVGKSYVRDVVRDDTEKGAEKFKKFTRLEFDLMQRWRSLFLHTENALLCENTQLQANLLRLRELRANCRKDLETISGMSSSKFQGASDDSD